MKDEKPLASTPSFNEALNDLITQALDLVYDNFGSAFTGIDITTHYDVTTNRKEAKITVHHSFTKEVD